MGLERIEVLLAKVEINRSSYQTLLNRGILPHYSKKVTTPGKRGFFYLYDEDEFMKAWAAYSESRKRGLGIDRVAREHRGTMISKFDHLRCVGILMKPVVPTAEELMEDFDARFKKVEQELYSKPIEELRRMVAELEAVPWPPRASTG